MTRPVVGQPFPHVQTEDLSGEFVQSAYDLIEEAKIYDWRFTRSKVLTSCVASFSAVEAYVNRIFFDCTSPTSRTKITTLAPVTLAMKNRFGSEGRGYSIREKMVRLIPLISKKEFDVDGPPLDLFAEFTLFRNHL